MSGGNPGGTYEKIASWRVGNETEGTATLLGERSASNVDVLCDHADSCLWTTGAITRVVDEDCHAAQCRRIE